MSLSELSPAYALAIPKATSMLLVTRALSCRERGCIRLVSVPGLRRQAQVTPISGGSQVIAARPFTLTEKHNGSGDNESMAR